MSINPVNEINMLFNGEYGGNQSLKKKIIDIIIIIHGQS